MAELLRRERDKRNHKQTAVAEVVGMDQRTLSKWESGDIPEALIWFRNLANYYGVSADYLLGTKAPHLSSEEQAAIELLAQLPVTRRGAAVAVLKAAVELTQDDNLGPAAAPANVGGGVTFEDRNQPTTQQNLSAEKDMWLALLQKILSPEDYQYIAEAVESGQLSDAHLARFLQPGQHKPVPQNLELFNHNNLTG